jgi:putative ABC transport system permease protein
MKYAGKYFGLIVKNLRRNLRRTMLCVMSFATSLFLFAALSCFPSMARRAVRASRSSVRIACHNRAGFDYPLPELYKRRIAGMPHVQAVAAQSWFGGIYRSPRDQFPSLAVDPEAVEIIWSDWDLSTDAVETFKRVRSACLVGKATMKRFGWRVGDQVTLRGTVYPVDVTLTIVGTSGARGIADLLVFRRDYLNALMRQEGRVDLYWIRASDRAVVSSVIDEVDNSFDNSPAATQSEEECSFLGSFVRNCGVMIRLAQLVGIVVMLCIAMATTNVAFMTARERTGELAVMRAMGFSPATLVALVVSEFIVIGVCGSIAGCGLAFAGLKLAFSQIGTFGAIQMPGVIVLKSVAIGGAIAAASSMPAVLRATRVPIAIGLRQI